MKKTKQTKQEFKEIARLSCSCGCGAYASIQKDLKTGKWIVLVIRDGWKQNKNSHIGYSILLDESGGDKMVKLAKTLLKHFNQEKT